MTIVFIAGKSLFCAACAIRINLLNIKLTPAFLVTGIVDCNGCGTLVGAQ